MERLYNLINYYLESLQPYSLYSSNECKGEDKNLKINMAGIGQKNISTKVKGDILEITGKRDDKTIYFQTFQLPKSINRKEIRASYIDGILEISLPKNTDKDIFEIEIL